MRPIWKGAINFGLLNVPVRMGSATEKENIAFRTLHAACKTPIKEKRWCPACNKEVGQDEIAKGYEYEKGRFAVLSDEELENLPIKSARYIQIFDFIKIEEVDPIYYIKTYYLAPEAGVEKPYLILRNAMQQNGRVAVAKITMRNKESLCLIRVIGKVLALETMFFPDEVRASEDIGIEKIESKVKILDTETEMANRLVENLTSPFDPEKYHDEYREELMKIIRAKIEGEEISEPKLPETDQPKIVDLMEMLRASVEATKVRPAKEKKDEKPKRKRTKAG